MTYESNLHYYFNVVSRRNEPNVFKADRGAIYEAFPNLLSQLMKESGNSLQNNSDLIYNHTIFCLLFFSIIHLTCTSHKYSNDSLLFYNEIFAITCVSLSWLPGGSYLGFIFRYSKLLEFFSWHIHLSTFFDYFFQNFAHILSNSYISHFWKLLHIFLNEVINK